MKSWLTGRGRQYLAAGAVAGVLAMAGCSASGSAASSPASGGSGASASSGAPGPAGKHQVVITGTNGLRFSPMTVHVHTGTVRITLKDMGAYPHNIVIPGLHFTSATVTGDPGGATTSFTVRFPHSGRYPFQCQYHASAGMVGVFIAS
jgi:plastocyanin